VVTFPARIFRGAAALFWDGIGRADLRDIALAAEPASSPIKQRFKAD
jgi:hypothetical protein